MRYASIATLAAALTMGATGMAQAQGMNQQYGQGGQGYGGQQFGQSPQQFGQGQRQFGQGGQQFGQGRQQYGQMGMMGPSSQRLQQRAALRRQLRQVGFQNIRILDAAYLVQASTQDGRTYLMVVDPPSQMMSQMTASGQQMGQMGWQGQQFRGQQFGQMGPQRQQFGGQGQQQQFGQSGQMGQQRSAMAQGSQRGMMQSGGSGAEATGAIGQTTGLDQEQVRTMLEERGLSNISNLQREGDNFTASADWQGEQVDVSVNARTGEITQPEEL